MSTNTYDLLLPDIPYSGDKIIIEYVYANHTGYAFCSKTRIVDAEPATVEDRPLWDNYMWDDVEGKPENFKEMILKPVAMFENPFFRSPHKLVLCEFWLNMETPSTINTRYTCKKTIERLKFDPISGYRPKQPHDPWFGIEQEYFVTGDDGVPVSYDPNKYSYEKLIIYTKIGHRHDKNIGKERELSNRHMTACLYAGITFGGLVRENGPSQWEYQIGPCPGETIGDHLNMSRYILQRLAEMFGLRVTFHPVPVHGTPLTSSGHLNFSTSKMRAKGGITFIRHAINLLANSEQDPLLKMYDPTLNQENNERLTNTSGHWHPQLHKFVCDVANKAFSTVRIPPLVNINGYGYFEDRRPSSALDPYAAADGIVRSSIFGDFLNTGFDSLKDLSVWDSDP